MPGNEIQSAPRRIFLTGATGFVGGAVLSLLYNIEPGVQVTALVRKEADAKKLQTAYPNIHILIGTHSSLDLLKSTAAEVDFVIHASGENIPAVCTMIDGLAASSTTNYAPGWPRPSLISISGSLSLIDLSNPTAKVMSRPWSDVTDAHTILSLPKGRMHAEADQAIISHAIAKGIGAMLISPGQLWGRGKGLLKTESHSVLYYTAIKTRGRAFAVDDGSATWSWSSISDVADAVVFLMQQAIAEGENENVRVGVGVNKEGYHFVRTGEVSMLERAEAASERLGMGEVEKVSLAAAAEIDPFGPLMWGAGASFRADRLTRMGWKPKDLDWKAIMADGDGGRA